MSRLDDVRFIISSLGRAEHQITLRNLPPEISKRVELWVIPSELKEYKKQGLKVSRVVEWPENIDSIYKKRMWLSQNMKDPHLMLDDDLQLHAWRSSIGKYVIAKDDPELFVRAVERGLLPLFDSDDLVACSMKFMADSYIKERGAYKRGIPGYVVNGYNPGACDDVDFQRVHFFSDMNQGIQAIQSGKKAVTFFGIVFSQSTKAALDKSGCGTQRTPFMKVDAGLKMLQHFPGVVTDFKSNTGQGGGITLMKRLQRLKTGVTNAHRDETDFNLRRKVAALGMDRAPKKLRWSMEESSIDFTDRLKQSWENAGFSGNFEDIKLEFK